MHIRYYLIATKVGSFYATVQCDEPFTMEEGLVLLNEKHPTAIQIVYINKEKAEKFLGFGENN